MHARKPLIAVGITATLLLTAACGAGGGSGSDDSAGAGGGDALTVLAEAGGVTQLTGIAEAFTEETGTQVDLVELPYDGLYDRVNSELSAGTPSFDVAALDSVWLPTFAAGLAPLDDFFTPEVEADLFPANLAEAKVDGTYVGVPAWTNAEILFYRTDLFEDPAEQQAFAQRFGYELAPPTTWQEFSDVAQFFTRDTDGDGETDLYGTDVKGAVETEWLAHVLQAGSEGVVLDADGNVIVDNQAHVDALAFYAGLNNDLAVAPPGAKQVDWAAAQNLFNQGSTAMTRFWAHAYPQIPEDAAVAGNVGVAPMIGGAAGTAGIPGPWFLSLPADGPKGELAREFLQFAYDNNAMGVESDLGLAARVSAFEEYGAQPGYEHFTALVTTLEADATAPRPATGQWQQIVDTVLVPTIQASLEPGADYQALLTEARGEIEALQE